ncbi:MAG TPA: hypothetical protein P5338_07820, partial [Bacteroidales bacterium]|nr:hypothetical protein [Bacteroidales bacterium]
FRETIDFPMVTASGATNIGPLWGRWGAHGRHKSPDFVTSKEFRETIDFPMVTASGATNI